MEFELKNEFAKSFWLITSIKKYPLAVQKFGHWWVDFAEKEQIDKHFYGLPREFQSGALLGFFRDHGVTCFITNDFAGHHHFFIGHLKLLKTKY